MIILDCVHFIRIILSTTPIPDVLGSVLRGREPVPPSAYLRGVHHRQVPRKEEARDATPSLFRRWQRLPVHVAGYVTFTLRLKKSIQLCIRRIIIKTRFSGNISTGLWTIIGILNCIQRLPKHVAETRQPRLYSVYYKRSTYLPRKSLL